MRIRKEPKKRITNNF